MKNLIGFIIVFLFISVICSCEEDDDFSSDPGLRIAFSSDTIRFDTIFTEKGSATKRMRVYNRNDKSLNIQSVELASGGESGFRINVDGVGGTVITDIDLLKKDSMYVFIEVTIDPLNSNSPMQVRDSIRFNINGQIQYVQLEAIGQDAIWWRNGLTVTQDTTLTAEKPFLVYDSIVVNKGATLNIDKNVRLYFHQGAGVKVYGSINAVGTLQEPVVFRGDRTDNLFTNVPYDRIPGQWEGVTIDSLSFNNHFEYFYLRNSTKGMWFEASLPSEKKATFLNTIVQNTNSHGVYAINCDIDFQNSLFANAGGSTVKLIGGSYTFLHCTLANYMSWWGMRKDAALTIGNVTDDGQRIIEFERCEFRNSIISGSGRSEIRQQNNYMGVEKDMNFYFEDCLIKSDGSDDAQLVNITWNEDAGFKSINKDGDYNYSYELDSISPAINKGNSIFSLSVPTDIRGISRLSDENPDLGCYEWIPTNHTP